MVFVFIGALPKLAL